MIYIIQCNHCPKQYIGETKRRLKDRFNEHRRPVEKQTNSSIQLSLELEDTKGQRLPSSSRHYHHKERYAAWRKPTHTDRYLDFNSNHPMYHKRSVVRLLRRAQNIPSIQKGKREETKRVKAVLRDNLIAPLPSSIAAKDRCRNSLPIYRPMAL